MENQHYKSYEQAALDILRGKKPEEEKPVQKEEQETIQHLSEEVHPDALHVKPVKMGGQTKYKVHAVGANHSDGIKVGEHLSDSELDDFSEMGGKIKHMKEESEELGEQPNDMSKSDIPFTPDAPKKNPPAKAGKYGQGVSTAKHLAQMAKKQQEKMKEEVEELDEMGPGRADPKAKDREELDQQMKDFMAKGGTVQQGKSKAPKRTGRMVAGGTLSGRERTMNKSGGRSYTAKMEEVEEDYDQLIEEMNAFEIELPEQLTFAHYLNAAKVFTESHEDAIVVADHFFRNQDESLVIESFTRSDIEDRVKMHQKAGNETTLPKYGMKNNKPYAEYTVTEKESGKKTKYIHHGTSRRVERMN